MTVRGGAFAALVLATIAAFFVTQHLKVSTPLYNGDPIPFPGTSNPVSGRVCTTTSPSRKTVRVSFKTMRVSFYLQHEPEDVSVYVTDSDEEIVATLASNRYMRVGVRNPDGDFSWNGREDPHSSGPFAPDGTYYLEIVLQHAGRTYWLTGPHQAIHILTSSPQPVVTSVRPSGLTSSSGPPVISPPQTPVEISFKRASYRSAFIQIYRTDLPGKPRMVYSFQVNPRLGRARWTGLIHGAAPPAGTYLIAMFATDRACNAGVYPAQLPPPAGTTRTGVSVRYLTVQAPLVPIGAGSDATALVDSGGQGFGWSLFRTGIRHRLAHGSVSPTGEGDSVSALRVPIPPLGAGLYTLVVRTPAHGAAAPLIASAGGRRAAAKVLVVLPALTWQGENPVDDTGDGLPSTLSAGDQVSLQRPLVDGLPAGWAQESALLTYLDKHKLEYQLTTDLALAEGIGPTLAGHTGVILDGTFRWAPPTFETQLTAFARRGGRVLVIGAGSLQSAAPLHAGASETFAGPATAPAAHDLFGAQAGPSEEVRTSLITAFSPDPVGIFSNSPALLDFPRYQAIRPPAGVPASLAGVSNTAPAVIGFPYGADGGDVVEIGLDGFNSRLAHNVTAQELFLSLWQLLSGQ
jgi:hypothetical protein